MLASVWDHPEIDVHALPTKVRLTLSRLETLTKEAARERRTHLTDDPDPEPLSRTLARLLTDISALGRILAEPLPKAVHDRLTAPWSAVSNAAAGILHEVSRDLPQGCTPPSIAPLTEAIAAYEAALGEVRREGLTTSMSNEAVARCFALGFVLDQFRRNFEDLLDRMDEVHRMTEGLNS